MQQCGSLCATAGGGIFSYGTIFYNPNEFSNHDPNSGMDLYNSLMSKYASNVDKTSIISENYYVSAEVGSILLAQAASTAPYLTRGHDVDTVNHFRFDTGMGLVVDWGAPPNHANGHVGTTCGFAQRAVQQGGGAVWHTIPNKVCG
jgi:hypothetical protein